MVDLLGNIFDEVFSIVKDWRPKREYDREEGYRDDLIHFLRKELNRPSLLGTSEKHSIQKESGRHLADIGIGRRVGIELKFNLKSKAQADRLFGQVDGFLEDYEEGIIIVLCGKTNKEQVEYLQEKLRRLSEPTLVGGKSVEIIIKTFKSVPRKQHKDIFGVELPEVKLPDII